MVTFVKIKSQEDSFWMLRLADYEDVMTYIKYFARNAWEGAKICISRIQELDEISHLSGNPEAFMLKHIAEAEANEAGEFQFKPLIHTASLISMKLKLLMDIVGDKKVVVVNENGGLCDLDGFLSCNNAEVVEERLSEKIEFPFEVDKTRKYKMVVLENDAELDYYNHIYNKYRDMIVLNNLLSRNKEEIMFHLANCEEVMTKTTFLNEEQAVKFLNLFSILSGKVIHIISDNFNALLNKVDSDDQLKQAYNKIITNNRVLFYNTSFEREIAQKIA